MPSEGGPATRGDDFEPRLRLHPASWLFVAANYLKAFLVPLIAAFIVGANRDVGWWAPAVAVGPLIFAALWQQWIYRYGFSARGLVIHEGLFFRNVRTIDYGRIENVDTERGLLHRLLGVAEVRVETSTGGAAEARIRVLDLHAVSAMREHIFERGARGDAASPDQPAEPAAEREEILLAVTPGDLVRFGLIDNRGMIVVAAVFGLLAQSGFFETLEERAEPLAGELPWDSILAFSLLTQVLLGIATVAGLVAATRVLSIIVAFVTLYGFRLTRHRGDLHTRYGLLTRIALTLRQRRIQAVHQTASPLHRLFKRVSLRVDLAGGSTPGAAQQPGQQSWRELWLAPICTRDDAERLIRAALPQADLSGLRWRGLAPRARWRLFRVLSWIWLLVASVPAVWLAGFWGIAILLAPLPLLWLHAYLYVKHTGWVLHEALFVLKRGWLTRKLSIAPRNRVQSVHLHESPFDRRYGMAELHVDNAGASSLSHRLVIPYLDRRDADELAAELYRPQLLVALRQRQ